MDLIKEAEKIINSHSYPLCRYCGKRCKTICLPAEMLVLISAEADPVVRLTMMENASHMLEEDYEH